MHPNEFPEMMHDTDVLHVLSVTSRKLRTLFDARVRERGLTLARARTLMHLARHECLTQKHLAVLLEVEGPTLVRLLDRMEEQGWIERRSVEGDRRAKHVVLTAIGHDIAGTVFALADQVRDDVFVGLTAQQLEATSTVLRIISDNVAALTPAQDDEL